jgi:thiol-disulfide isomerase/thioredoxin
LSFTLNNQKRLIRGILLIFMLLLLPIITGCSVGTTGLNAGDIAPDFKLDGLDGKTYILSNFRGSPVLLNFWATWCGPCQGEMPYLNDIATEWADKGLVVLAVNVGEGKPGVQDFVDYYGYSMTVLLDTASAVSSKYDITGIPTTYFVDEDGIIQKRVIGAFQDKESIEQYLTDLVQ